MSSQRQLTPEQFRELYAEVADPAAIRHIEYLHRTRIDLTAYFREIGYPKAQIEAIMNLTKGPHQEPIRFCAQLYDDYKFALAIDEIERLSIRDLTICMIPTYRIDTFITQGPTGEIAVIIDTFLGGLAAKCAVLASRAIRHLQQEVPWRTYAKEAERVILSSYYMAKRQGVHADLVTSPLLHLPLDERPHFLDYVRIINHFILFHELAHLHLDHINQASRLRISPNSESTELKHRGNKELAADCQAAAWLQQLFHPYHVSVCLSFWFAVNSIVEHYSIRAGQPVSKSHPPSDQRWDAVFKRLEIVEQQYREIVTAPIGLARRLRDYAYEEKAYPYCQRQAEILAKYCYG